MELLEINNNNIKILLEKFNKEINKEGFIIDKGTGEIVKCRYTGKPLTENNLGGVLPGSDIFIEDSDIAYAGYVMEFLASDNE